MRDAVWHSYGVHLQAGLDSVVRTLYRLARRLVLPDTVWHCCGVKIQPPTGLDSVKENMS